MKKQPKKYLDEKESTQESTLAFREVSEEQLQEEQGMAENNLEALSKMSKEDRQKLYSSEG